MALYQSRACVTLLTFARFNRLRSWLRVSSCLERMCKSRRRSFVTVSPFRNFFVPLSSGAETVAPTSSSVLFALAGSATETVAPATGSAGASVLSACGCVTSGTATVAAASGSRLCGCAVSLSDSFVSVSADLRSTCAR